MSKLTYMDCWHYIAPLIPVEKGDISMDIYVMTFRALKEAEERRKEAKPHKTTNPNDK